MAEQKNNSEKSPPKELGKLEVFLGKWKIDGRNFPAAPNEPETPVSGEDSYEWITGNFFIVSDWHHLTKEGGHEGMSILGYDSEAKKLFTQNFDNLGFERKYILEPENRSWKFVGAKERAVRKFSVDGKSYVENWEVLSKYGNWHPLCVMNGKKI